MVNIEVKISGKKYFYKIISIIFYFTILSCLFSILNVFGMKRNYEITFLNSFFLMIIIFIIYLFFSNRLAFFSIKTNNSSVYINVIYYKFLFLKKSKNGLADFFKYSYNSERTSRIGKKNVFRLYYKNEIFLCRENDLDGFEESEILAIVNALEKQGVKKNNI
jgi:hypothetical protein